MRAFLSTVFDWLAIACVCVAGAAMIGLVALVVYAVPIGIAAVLFAAAWWIWSHAR